LFVSLLSLKEILFFLLLQGNDKALLQVGNHRMSGAIEKLDQPLLVFKVREQSSSSDKNKNKRKRTSNVINQVEGGGAGG
jgi:hypothetical protein